MAFVRLAFGFRCVRFRSFLSRAHSSTPPLLPQFIVFLSSLLVANISHAAVGATQGSFSVNANGGANYTIPLTIAPGTAGMVPSLSITYDKQVDSGLLGIGWSIGGLSIIQRCGATIAIDGFKGGVNYDANDRFCLDGQRLIAVKDANGVQGAYGANGTEYRTERESFSKIVSYGTIPYSAGGNGPARFTVWTKSGQILEYGNTPDSSIEAQGKATIRLWANNKVQDRKGNYYTLTYSEDNANGEYRISRIDYTGNSNASLTPYNSVQFVYEARADIIPRFEGGSLAQVVNRLSNVKTYAGANLVRDYRFGYDYGTSIGQSRLIALTECGSDGTTCLAPTSITWLSPDTAVPFSSPGWGAAPFCDPSHLTYGDFNGDGRQDLLCNNDTGQHIISFSNGQGTFISGNWWPASGAWCDPSQIAYGDFNGDGRQDFICNGPDNRHLIAFSNGDGTFSSPGPWWPAYGAWCDRSQLGYGDFNGDGRLDLICNGPDGRHIIAFSNGDGTFSSPGWGPTPFCDPLHVSYGDFNGDGRMDLICNGDDGKHILAFSNGDGTFSSPGPWWPSYGAWCDAAHMGYGDINGDGRLDLICNGDDGKHIVAFSTGDGTFSSPGWGPDPFCDPSHLSYGDFNGDGRQDLLCTNDSGQHIIALSNGRGTFVAGSWWPSNGAWCDRAHLNSGDFNGDGRLDFICNADDGRHILAFQTGSGPDLLSSLTDGLTKNVSLMYNTLADGVAYSVFGGSIYPYQETQGGIYVVSSYTISDGISGAHSVSYHYTGAKFHHTGAGWLGFQRIEITDNASGIKTVNEYDQRYEAHTYSLPTYSETRVNNVRTGAMQSFWTGVDLSGGRSLPQLTGSLQQSFDLDGSAIACNSIDNTYDGFGNVLTAISKTGATCAFTAAFVKTATNTYFNDATNWILGKVTQAQVKSDAPSQLSQTRTSAFNYDSAGYLASETIEPGSSVTVATTYALDAFGNRTSTAVSGANVASRTSTARYDTFGRLTSSANALGHSNGITYNAVGLVASETGANNLTTLYEYDSFGRKVKETGPDSTNATVAFLACDTSCSANEKYKITTQTSGSAPTTTYYDMLGRGIRTQTQGFDGTTVTVLTEYDNLGRVARASHPSFPSEAPHWTSYYYDAIGRIVKIVEPDSGVTSTAYTGLTTTVTNPLNQTGKTIKNVIGQTTKAIDPAGNATTYAYDASGNLTQVTDAGGNVVTMEYDQRGRKTAMNDPDMGRWTYAYSVLGELLSQTDAKNQTQTLTYDILGRMRTRSTQEGQSTWTYDTAANGIGKLAGVTGPSNYSENYTYDNLGRLIQTVTALGADSFTVNQSYDALSRADTVMYPQTQAGQRLSVKNIYNDRGYLTEVRNAQSNQSYWLATAVDAHGRVTEERLGNGLTSQHTYNHLSDDLGRIRTGNGATFAVQDLSYTFDVLGNLKGRTDNLQALTETFSYDSLNRLTGITGPAPKFYTYDAIGNLLSKTDVGQYTYGGVNNKPHAVINTSGIINASYAYDANGNLTSGAGRSVTYTSFNKPASITQNGNTISFIYDASFNRIQKTSAAGQTIYLGKMYERVVQGTTVQHKYYVYGSNNLIATVTVDNANVTQTRYMHADHLGSIDVITDETGNVVQRLSFDAHGKPRQSNWLDATQPIVAQTTLGYTGHTMDDEVGLINMNARIYDPMLGRFMTADMISQSPVSQGLNRYSYTDNNPLSRTDPTGHSWWTSHRFLAADPAAATLIAGWYVDRGNEKFLMNHPQYIPYVRAAGDAAICYFTCWWSGPWITAAFDGIFDARFTHLAGGDSNDVSRAFLKGYAMGVVGHWGSNPQANPSNSLGSYIAHHEANTYFQQSVDRFAENRWHMSGTTVNVYLTIFSFVGKGVLPSRFTSDGWDRTVYGIRGWLNRGIAGVPFDVADTVLALQGMMTASAWDYVNSDARGQPLTGHSLGSLDVANLAAEGVTTEAYLYAVPVGEVTSGATDIAINSGDAVSGFGATAWLNPSAQVYDLGFLTHACAAFILGCGN